MTTGIAPTALMLESPRMLATIAEVIRSHNKNTRTVRNR